MCKYLRGRYTIDIKKKVFVDVDDTLILFTENENESYFGEALFGHYNPNYPLIERLRKFNGNIVVWSGGGPKYAERIAKKIFPRNLEWSVARKFDMALVKPGDIIIDDTPGFFNGMRETEVRIYEPHEEWE